MNPLLAQCIGAGIGYLIGGIVVFWIPDRLHRRKCRRIWMAHRAEWEAHRAAIEAEFDKARTR